MRPFGVEPGSVPVEFSPERVALEGDQDRPRALALQRSDAPLDDGEAAMLAYGTESFLDASTATPSRERGRGELRAVVGDQVSRSAAVPAPDAGPRCCAARSDMSALK
jgi:hypothetical protein